MFSRFIPAASALSSWRVTSSITSFTTSSYWASEFISLECPRQCIKVYLHPRPATVANISGSAAPPLTSLMMAAPASTANRAVAARIVSMLISGPFPTSALTTGITRRCSSSAETRSAPGRVDSPPISMISTPSSIISKPRWTACSKVKCFPPSAKESGVTLTMPITRGWVTSNSNRVVRHKATWGRGPMFIVDSATAIRQR